MIFVSNTDTEKVWSSTVAMQYPKQWIVFVDIEVLDVGTKYMGHVHLVTPDQEEAYRVKRELGDSMGRSMVFQGYDDTPQIGGFPIWGR